MSTKRKIEVFGAGCPVCKEAITAIQKAECPSCDITIQDMQTGEGANRAKQLGVQSVPAVAIDGKLANCCTGRGIDIPALQSAGLGKSI